jgi:SAM-dependent methyltransferase
MGKEQDSRYYDKLFSGKNKYASPYPPGAYIDTWEQISEMIDKKARILDMGCGVGQFALFLKNKGFKNYTGIDFSDVAIQRSKGYIPEFRFEKIDFYSQEFIDFFEDNQFDIIVCLEALEHIYSDLILLALLPRLPIIFSVPTFDDKSHVRWFKTPIDVYNRYENEVRIDEYYFFKQRYHLVKGELK